MNDTFAMNIAVYMGVMMPSGELHHGESEVKEINLEGYLSASLQVTELCFTSLTRFFKKRINKIK